MAVDLSCVCFFMKIKEIFKAKSYSHLDYKKDIKTLEKNIKDPKWIAKHGFLPLIHITLRIKKREGHLKPFIFKNREIFYSSHTDSYIYQYYADLVEKKYEAFLVKNDFSNVPTAYRSLNGKCNIDFAKEAFDFIKQQKDAIVFVTDFHSFFDSLNHKILKQNLCKILGTKKHLSDDNYAVYKSLTKACYFDLEDIAIHKNVTRKSLQRGKRIPQILLKPDVMRDFKKEHLKFYSDLIGSNEKGIPQGTSVSAVYANVYMIDFDKQMSDYVNSVNGFYRRYSDDIICIVPFSEKDSLDFIFEKLRQNIDIEISSKKTKRFHISNGKIVDCISKANESDDKRLLIEYLGFSFDGNRILLKDGTLNKYYKKLDNRLYLMKKLYTEKGKIVGKKHFYKYYSHLGEASRIRYIKKYPSEKNTYKHSNFFSYVNKASKIMNSPSIRHQVRRHWKHINNFFLMIEEETHDIKGQNSE
ncbi:MAG: hypothetical protein IJ530_02025 [Treponema sp.]|uniref:reverse transcriptase domain-containing protein n=1 Tax=Treponema sp. TaxID=166 RepID=UPI0025D043C4|nr:reverse transcriptase domain-containing protein [Treponema sp.]MBQ8678519.1 hypothetical protein [Treponema sp.]